MNQRLGISIRLLSAVILMSAAFASPASAANPSEARITFSLKRVFLSGSLEDLSIRVTHTFPSDQALEAGASCEVELSGCVSAFVPAGFKPPAERSCEPFLIGSKTISAGARSVRFNLLTKPVGAPPSSGRQVSFQTKATCTDSLSAQSVIVTSPRAKKVSRTDGRGVNRNKFFKLLRRSLTDLEG